MKSFAIISLLLAASTLAAFNGINENELLRCHNKFRADPQSGLNLVIKLLSGSKRNSRGSLVYAGWNSRIANRWNEGDRALKEAVVFFKQQINRMKNPRYASKMRTPLVRVAKLDQVAKTQSEWLAKHPNQPNKHAGRNGAGLKDRIWQFVRPMGGAYGMGENIAPANPYFFPTAEWECLGWIIDDGVRSKGHRNNFYKEDNRYVGIGTANWYDAARRTDAQWSTVVFVSSKSGLRF